MAKEERTPDRGKVKVIYFELEGSNQSLRESIRDIVGAIGRVPQLARTQVKTIAAPSDAGKGEPEEEVVIAVDGEQVDDETTEVTSAAAPRKRAVTRSPAIVDIDLKQGSMSLMDFLQKLNPSSDVNRYVCALYWLKANANLAEAGMDEVHTCYRAMKWNTPADAAWPLRDMKKPKYGYVRAGSKNGMFAITHIGENHVRDLAKAVGLDV